MKVQVDPLRCEGTAFCQAIGGDVFRLGADGVAIVIRSDIAPGDLPAIEDAVRTCPTQAISLERMP